MVYIAKMSREQSKAIDIVMKAQHEKNNPVSTPNDPAYRHMQNITDKAKRGEKL